MVVFIVKPRRQAESPQSFFCRPGVPLNVVTGAPAASFMSETPATTNLRFGNLLIHMNHGPRFV